jgi:hypothetical protein
MPNTGGNRYGCGRRAQASVLGVALLLGITALGVTLVVVIGAAGLNDIEGSIEQGQAETALTQFDAQAAQVALGDSQVQTVPLTRSGRGGALTAAATGRIVVEAQDGTEYLNQTLGTVTRETSDQVVAYQGGGVWRGTGNASRMISPPEFHYRAGTLTLPLVAANPADAGTGEEVTLQAAGSRQGLGPGVVREQILTVSITSDHYVAWADYFRDRIDGVSVTVHHNNRTVEADLARLDLDGTYRDGLVADGDIGVETPKTVDTAVVSAGSVSDKHGSIECAAGSGSDCITTNTDTRWMALDAGIEVLLDNAEDDHPDANIAGDTTLTSGAYYSEGVGLSGDTLSLDLSSGNVTLFVDGNIGLDGGKIAVENGQDTNHYARIYTNGDVAMATGQAEVSVDSGNASRFQLYGTSEMHFAMGQSKGFTGAVYAPRQAPAEGSNEAVGEYGLTSATSACPTDVDVCVGQGSGDVHGAIIGGPTSIQQGTSFDYGEGLRKVEPRFPAGTALPPPVTYLHISVNRIDVDGASATQGTVTLPGRTIIADLAVSERSDGDEYRFDASGTTEADRVDEYHWDFDADGSRDRTTTGPTTTVACDAGVIDCDSLPDEASVTAVDTSESESETATADYPASSPGPGGNNAPTVDSFSVTDNSECSDVNPGNGNGGCKNKASTDHAEFEISWGASDADGDLDSVTVEVRRDGEPVETYTGYSGTETYHLDGDYGTGPYTFTVTAEDAAGNSDSDSVSDSAADGSDP